MCTTLSSTSLKVVPKKFVDKIGFVQKFFVTTSLWQDSLEQENNYKNQLYKNVAKPI